MAPETNAFEQSARPARPRAQYARASALRLPTRRTLRHWIVAALAAALLGAGVPAQAAPFVGIADNEVATEWGQKQIRALGVPAVRVYVWWRGQAEPDPGDVELVERAQATGARVFVTVTGHVTGDPLVGGPRTATERAAYAAFVASLARRTGVRDVMVWNEPNFFGFWRSRPDPVDYGKLLAAAYDALHPLGVRVWAFSTCRTKGVVRMVRGVAAWYRASGRRAPLFDGVSHHPYALPGEPWASGPGGPFLVGDTPRLLALYDDAFRNTGQCRRRCSFPVVYGELGWATGGDAPYVARVGVDEQVALLARARSFLARFPRVIGFFNFELRDGNEFATGLFYPDGTPKPAAHALFAGQPDVSSDLPAPVPVSDMPLPIIGL